MSRVEIQTTVLTRIGVLLSSDVQIFKYSSADEGSQRVFRSNFGMKTAVVMAGGRLFHNRISE